ncbi:MAG: hypothetical protein F9K44_15140 [Hyphomicrobiaceae bacterium]|nr:MAG: hypothetical protein F9K44_15140 [Hyphomicrobiaceae bacterium]
MSARRLPRSFYLSLKAATRRLVAVVGGQEAAALVSRVGHQEFSNYGSPAERYEERFMPIDVVADLEDEAGEPVITRPMVERQGYLVVPLPKGSGPALLIEASGRSAAELGRLMIHIGEALQDDGRISSRAEARPILASIHQLMVDLAALAETVRADAGREGNDA